MKITPQEITIREIANNYIDNPVLGVRGYDLLLDIRPAYQRLMVYTQEEEIRVVESVMDGFPIGIMYWAKNPTSNSDAPYSYEVIDGQQRTISLCEYVAMDKFAVRDKLFSQLDKASQNKILDYKILVYLCEGDDDEKLAWFRRINIAGKALSEQELRNAIFTGKWLASAKNYFKPAPSSPAYDTCNKYLPKSQLDDWDRWNGLQLGIAWAAGCTVKDDDAIRRYMAAHQGDDNANELFDSFQAVFEWIEELFYTDKKGDAFAKTRTRALKGGDWKEIYDKYHEQYSYDTSTQEGMDEFQQKKDALEAELVKLFEDGEVENKHGAYWYVLDHQNEPMLSLRRFSKDDKNTLFAEQGGRCPVCHMNGEDKQYDITDMQADHIVPWSKSGKTTLDNGAMLCAHHNNLKDNKTVSEQQVKKAMNELRFMAGYPERL